MDIIDTLPDTLPKIGTQVDKKVKNILCSNKDTAYSDMIDLIRYEVNSAYNAGLGDGYDQGYGAGFSDGRYQDEEDTLYTEDTAYD